MGREGKPAASIRATTAQSNVAWYCGHSGFSHQITRVECGPPNRGSSGLRPCASGRSQLSQRGRESSSDEELGRVGWAMPQGSQVGLTSTVGTDARPPRSRPWATEGGAGHGVRLLQRWSAALYPHQQENANHGQGSDGDRPFHPQRHQTALLSADWATVSCALRLP